MNIPMPTEAEKKKSVSYIKKEGLIKKDNLFSAILRIYRAIGIKNIFFGVSDCLYIALMISAIAFGFTLALEPNEFMCGVSLVSPMFFISAQLLTMWKDSMTGTQELKAVCKYKPSHITAFRMLCFSSVSILLDIPAALIASHFDLSEFFKVLLVSFCSLFVYALLMTLVLLCLRSRICEYILPFAWTAAHVIPFLDGAKWLAMVNSLKSGFGAAVCLIAAALYVVALDFLVKKGERKYAQR